MTGSTPQKAWARVDPMFAPPSLDDGYTGMWEELDEDGEVVASGTL